MENNSSTIFLKVMLVYYSSLHISLEASLEREPSRGNQPTLTHKGNKSEFSAISLQSKNLLTMYKDQGFVTTRIEVQWDKVVLFLKNFCQKMCSLPLSREMKFLL